MYGIKFNGKHSYRDFGVTIAEKDIGYPDKEKIKVKVPFSNVEYDFSNIYGEQTYTPRPLTYTLNVLDKNNNNTTEKINVIETQLSNWLMNSNGKQKLYDDAIPGYYFFAEVEGGLSFDELWNSGTLTVEFTAYPFMIAELPEGHDIWDDFNFDLDIAQDVDFNVSGSLDVTLYNLGVPSLTPTITASTPMTIEMGNRTFNVPSGESKSLDFTLKPGENDMTISGNGSISFTFYKELI